MIVERPSEPARLALVIALSLLGAIVLTGYVLVEHAALLSSVSHVASRS